jgi:ATP-dependent exoDNAse (exonuclease V) beta subunit
MTIHKAKGLKFKSVVLDLIPTNKKTSKKDYWTNFSIDGLDELSAGMLPMKEKKLTFVGLEHIYKEELEKTELDFLNMIYVAFTRPVSALYIISQKKQKAQNAFTSYLQHFISSQNLNFEASLFEFGDLLAPITSEKSASGQTNSHESENNKAVELKDMISSLWQSRVEVAPADPVYWEQVKSRPTRVFGKLLHNILSEIYTIDDVDRVISKYHLSGIIDENEAASISRTIESLLEQEEIRMFYSGKATVRNETELISEKNGVKTIQRPDRTGAGSPNLTCRPQRKSCWKSCAVLKKESLNLMAARN